MYKLNKSQTKLFAKKVCYPIPYWFPRLRFLLIPSEASQNASPTNDVNTESLSKRESMQNLSQGIPVLATSVFKKTELNLSTWIVCLQEFQPIWIALTKLTSIDWHSNQ